MSEPTRLDEIRQIASLGVGGISLDATRWMIVEIARLIVERDKAVARGDDYKRESDRLQAQLDAYSDYISPDEPLRAEIKELERQLAEAQRQRAAAAQAEREACANP